MIISFTGIKQFRKCQRQWCFKTFGESRSEEDSLRRELFLLSKLQSIWSWRGNLVDSVITLRIVPAIKNGWTLNQRATLDFARGLFDKQLAFAKANRLREAGMKASSFVEEFAALSDIDYGKPLSDETIEGAWIDVENALVNLFKMEDLLELLKGSSHLIAQRGITFDHMGLTFRAFPDLIAFFDDQPPLIVDWKVHWRAVADYRLQLASYALALTRCEPHKDFPASLNKYKPAEFKLIEAQLLTGIQREYFLSEDDLDRTENFITSAAFEMKLAVDDRPNRELDPYDFPITSNPDQCEYCNFRKVCTEEGVCPQPVQMSLLY